MTLKEILHELAGRLGAHHLHDEIDALPDGPKPKSKPADEGST
jgi:hypothetical protein